MKKILLTIFLFVCMQSIFAQISWMGNEFTSLSTTQYLGDNILFEIQSFPIASNQGAQVYIDWNNDGYGGIFNVDYYPLNFIKNQDNNSWWNSYVRMRAVGTHNRKYLGWQTGFSDYVTGNFGTFNVSPLNTPSSQTATPFSEVQINLSWLQDAQNHNIMVVRKLSAQTWTEPLQGTAYSLNDFIGDGIVVFNGSGTSLNNTGLTANAAYDYKFYSENNSYYSDGVTASASTLPFAFAVTGSGSYCQGSGGLPVGVANSETGVTYELWKDGVATGTTQPGSTGSTVSFGNKLAGTYTVKGTNAGGTTTMTGSAVMIENALPLDPTVPDPSIAICAGAYIYATVGSEETTDWYSASSEGTLLATGPANYTPVATGTYYAQARNTTSGCISATRTALTVTQINALPTAVISGDATICAGTSTNLTISLTGTSPWNFTYSDGSTSTVVNSIYNNSAVISVSPVTSKIYTIISVSGGNSCGGNVSGSAVITVNPMVTPTFTEKPGASTCANTDATYTTEAIQSTYVWSYPGSTLGTDYTITSGGTSTSNTVTLKWKTSGSKSVGVNYTPSAGCASNTPTIATTTVENLSATFTVAPDASTCAGTDVTYTTQAGQLNYIWTIPGTIDGDYTITSGSTSTNSVTLTWLTAGDKTVVVNYTGVSGCPLTGAPATTSVHVNVVPDAAGAIIGTASITQGQNGVTYTVDNITNATSYIWTYTPGTGIAINGTGSSITIDFSYTSASGNLTVQGLNDCGAGTVSADYLITVAAPVGPIAYAVTGTGSYCTSGGTGILVGLTNSETDVTYELFKNGTTTGITTLGTGSSFTFATPQLAGIYTVKGTKNANTTNMTGSAVSTAFTPPAAFAGNPDLAIMGVPYLLSGATATNYTSVKWLLITGNGSFSNDALLHPTFTGTISGQNVTLQLTAKNGVCDDATSTVSLIMIPAGDSKTWNGTNTSWNDPNNWDPIDGSVPFQTTDVTIPTGLTNYPLISGTAICKNLTIQSGSVTIASGGSLTVAGTLTNAVGNAGLVVQSGGSLIESTTGVAATVERTISTATQWHYISAPNNNTLSDKFTGNFLQSWDEPTHAWSYITATNATLNRVQGYSLWVKIGTPTYSFTGTLNTGNQSKALTYTTGSANGNNGANFLGNPYPSSLDWAGLQGTYGAVYYWNGGGYDSYINGLGEGSQFVPPMQGFFIVADANGTFAVTNDNRVHSTTSFYKSGSEIKANTLVLATVGESYSDKLFVNFNPVATEGFDQQNDAYKFLGYTAGVSELYSYTGDKKLSIDVRPDAQVIQLGFTNTLSGDYQIGIHQVADIPLVYLEDTKTSTFHDLLAGPYKFSYTAGESDKRFILHFGTTGLKETRKDAANIYSYQKTVYINMADQKMGDIFIYNIAGQQVASKLSAQGMNEIKLPNGGNYIVKVISKNSTVVRKVFIQQ